MHMPKASMAVLAAALLIPLGSAELTFNTPSEAVLLDPDGGDQSLEFTAALSCDEFLNEGTLLNEGTQTREVTITHPDGLSGTSSVSVDFDGTACTDNPQEQEDVTSDPVNITITPGLAAPGMKELQVGLASGDDNGTFPIKVDYRPGYVLNVNQEFPVTVEKDENGDWIPVEFTADIVLSANANTMVMMQVTDKNEFGTMSGLFANSPHIFRDLTADQVENGIVQTVEFSYQPTAEGWETDTVEFVTWSHWLDEGSMKTDDQSVTWTFENGALDEKGEKGAPGFSAGIASIAILGAALVAARRRA